MPYSVLQYFHYINFFFISYKNRLLFIMCDIFGVLFSWKRNVDVTQVRMVTLKCVYLIPNYRLNEQKKKTPSQLVAPYVRYKSAIPTLLEWWCLSIAHNRRLIRWGSVYFTQYKFLSRITIRVFNTTGAIKHI